MRSEVLSPPEKLQRTSKAPAELYCPPTPDFSNLVRHMSNLYCPQAYSAAVNHPTSTSRLWIVGIMSVGTESVGIAWCTRLQQPISSTSSNLCKSKDPLQPTYRVGNVPGRSDGGYYIGYIYPTLPKSVQVNFLWGKMTLKR